MRVNVCIFVLACAIYSLCSTLAAAEHLEGTKYAVARKAIYRANNATEQRKREHIAEPNRQLNSTAALISKPRPSQRRLAYFFAIDEVLANEHGAEPASGPTRPIDQQLGGTIPIGKGGEASSLTEEPFGLRTFNVPNSPLWKKWEKVELEMASASSALEGCQAESIACRRVVAIINRAMELNGSNRLKWVNEQVNASIRYTPDILQWNLPDVWTAPVELSGRGSFDTEQGDCEEYAIAKFFILLQAGTPESDLRLFIVYDSASRFDHAVLGVHQDGQWIILDNYNSELFVDVEARGYVPLFSLKQAAIELFAAPYSGEQKIQYVSAGERSSGCSASAPCAGPSPAGR